MELTVANDFQNNLDQASINSLVSHLADTENNTAYSKKSHQKAQRFLKSE